YDEYIATDVVRYVDSTYRTLADRRHRGIGGLSMGGFGAMILSLRHPDVFAAAASHSGVVSILYSGGKPFTAPPRYAQSIADVRGAPSGGFWQLLSPVFGDDIERWRASEPARAAERLKQAGRQLPALFIDCGREDGLVEQNR